MLRMTVRGLLVGAVTVSLAHASHGQVCTPAKLISPICSFSALNDSCNLNIDRLNATNPPMIYARRGAVITVHVNDMSAFEKLSLDATYPTTVLPPDQFSQAMAALSANLGKLTIVNPQHSLGLTGANPNTVYDKIIEKQSALKEQLNKIDALKIAEPSFTRINYALQAPPADVCPAGQGQAANGPWLDFTTWKATTLDGLRLALNEVSKEKIKGFQDDYDAIQVLVVQLVDSIDDRAFKQQDMVTTVRSNQTGIKASIDALTQVNSKLDTLRSAVEKIVPAPSEVVLYIKDQQPGDKNYQTEQFLLNDVNILLPDVKHALVTPPVSDSQTAFLAIADTPSKQKIITINVTYQSSPRFEFAAGLMVPTRPYHSYVAAGGVVQENLTYTVIPAVNTNILLGREQVARRQRVAEFATIAVGYNPATSAVEFGAGASFAWKTIVISGLADIGRDTQLNGLTIGQATSGTPATVPYWSVRPAIALSVRLPLGSK